MLRDRTIKDELVQVSTLKMAAAAGAVPGDDSTLSAPGRKTNVPEFHDCQRFIVTEGQARVYDSLYAIFASEHLDSIFGPSGDSLVNQGVNAAPAAEILSLGGTYEPLHIQPGFNCLYLKRAGLGWTAWMVPSGPIEQDCKAPQDPSVFLTAGKPLDVQQVPGLDHYGDDDFPPVARWDWDTIGNQQVIGLKCGKGWCEVGPRKRFATRPALSPPMVTTGAPSTQTPGTNGDRVYRIKGWYDEQELASANNPLVPSGIVGTFIPDSMLADHNDVSKFAKQWIRVAEAYLSSTDQGYKAAFNLDAGTAGVLSSTLYLCYGTRSNCTGISTSALNQKSCKGVTFNNELWWLRITSADGTTIYRCVSRMDHSKLNLTVPATARWRWIATDETIWVRCMNGCCQGGA